MKMAKKRSFRIPIRKIMIFIVVILIASFVLKSMGAFKKSCTNEDCFLEAVKECKATEYVALRNNNYYLYDISGRNGPDCEISIKVEKLAAGSSVTSIEMFEGKKMDCLVPRDVFASSFGDLSKLVNFCTGPLKEAIYEQIVAKLYGLIIQNMGEILDEVESSLYEI